MTSTHRTVRLWRLAVLLGTIHTALGLHFGIVEAIRRSDTTAAKGQSR